MKMITIMNAQKITPAKISKPIAYNIHHCLRVLFDDCIVVFYGGANRYTSVDALEACRNFLAETDKKPCAVCARVDVYKHIQFNEYETRKMTIFHGKLVPNVDALPIYEYHGFMCNASTTYPQNNFPY